MNTNEDRFCKPWCDKTRPWDERVALYKMARQAEAVTRIGDSALVPVIAWDEAERELRAMEENNGKQKERTQDFYIKELQGEFATMNGILFGKHGAEGMLVQLQRNQDKILSEITTTREEVNRLTVAFTEKQAILEHQVEVNKQDINGIGHKVCALQQRVEGKAERMMQTLQRVLLPVVAAGVLGLLVLGVKQWLMGG